MKKIVYALAFVLVLVSCKKEEASSICTDATVLWGGDPAADGLGWYLSAGDSVDHKTYIPQNLPDNFKIDGQAVHVCMYETNEKFYCQCVRPLNKYHITTIRRL